MTEPVHCSACRAPLPSADVSVCPTCGVMFQTTGDLRPAGDERGPWPSQTPTPYPWTGAQQGTPTPYPWTGAQQGTPTPYPWVAGQGTPTPYPWVAGQGTPTPYPVPPTTSVPAPQIVDPFAPPPRVPSAPNAFGTARPDLSQDLPPGPALSQEGLVVPVSKAEASALTTPDSRGPSTDAPNASLTHANLFDDVDEPSNELYVVGGSLRTPTTRDLPGEAQKAVVIKKGKRITADSIRRHTVGLNIEVQRAVVKGRTAYVITGLRASKANLLAARLNQVGMQAEAMHELALEEALTVPRSLGESVWGVGKAMAVLTVLFVVGVVLLAEYVEPLLGQWPVTMRADLLDLLGIDRRS